jgi:AcrR family transcriptional regulator
MKRARVKRPYDASGRRENAERTRVEILAAAHRLFVARGYQGTTMSEIAAEAKVAVDTVYASVGKKQSLLRLLVETSISGTASAVPAQQRDYVQAMRVEPDARRKLVLYAQALRRILERLAPLLSVLHDAAASDDELADLWKKIAQRRAANMRAFVSELAATGQLRADVDLDEAADVIWATNAPEFYLLLTGDRGWSSEKFEAWLSRTWIRLLLRD